MYIHNIFKTLTDLSQNKWLISYQLEIRRSGLCCPKLFIPNILSCLFSDTWTDPIESTLSLHLLSGLSKVNPRYYILLFLQHLCLLVYTSVIHKYNCKLHKHAQASLDVLFQPSTCEAAHTLWSCNSTVIRNYFDQGVSLYRLRAAL